MANHLGWILRSLVGILRCDQEAVAGLVVAAVAVELLGKELSSRATSESFPGASGHFLTSPPLHPKLPYLFSLLAQGFVLPAFLSTALSCGFCLGFPSSRGRIQPRFTAFALSSL